MRDSIRLIFRMHRFELVALADLAAVSWSSRRIYVAGQLDAVGFGPVR